MRNAPGAIPRDFWSDSQRVYFWKKNWIKSSGNSEFPTSREIIEVILEGITAAIPGGNHTLTAEFLKLVIGYFFLTTFWENHSRNL